MKHDHLPVIVFKAIDHKDHRYDTVGDWFVDGDIQHFRVSKMNSVYEFLVLIHEMIEWFLCKQHGISEESVTAFDLQFEERRKLGLEREDAEPGDDRKAPYHKEHRFATKIEKLVARALRVSWKNYDNRIMSL